jgi:Fe-S cluster assembly ATP-binding protein
MMDRNDVHSHANPAPSQGEGARTLLDVRGLTANVAGVPILKGIDLTVLEGEIHAIMGPNGSGKSTFAKVLAGHPAYEVTGGTVLFKGKDLLTIDPEERARAGVFLGFQYPVEIPGVTNSAFLRLAYNTVQGARGKDELDPLEFDDFIREKMKLLDMDPAFLDRSVNEGFSGGEKKRNEVLQLAVLEPTLAILDETDSGLDIDALRVVANGVNSLQRTDNAFVLVTHYQRLLNYIVPHYVHVMESGRIIKTGGKELARELESRGYDWVVDEFNATKSVASNPAVNPDTSFPDTVRSVTRLR